MGWARGSELLNKLIISLMTELPGPDHHSSRSQIYTDWIEAFEDLDMDTFNECLDIDEAFDEAYLLKYPEDFDIDLEDDD